MPKNRKYLIEKFINEGFTYRTLSLFSDEQLIELSKKILKEEVSNEDADKAKSTLIQKKEEELASLRKDLGETEEELDIETDDTGNPDVDIDGTPLLREKEIGEDFDSKAQQKYLYAVNPAAADKLASKMTKKDYENLPERVDEEEVLEKWVMSLVESNTTPEITKSKFLKAIKENLGMKSDVDTPFILNTPEQDNSFELVTSIANELEPPMTVMVDGFDDAKHLNGYLKSEYSDKIIDLNICPKGDIKLDGNALGEIELSETDRDVDGEYNGAPEATTAPSPVKTPTIAPSRPGEKKRRGPFEKPKTTPKPKAKNKSTLPEWLKSTNLGKSLTT